jgi:hypothetical protein
VQELAGKASQVVMHILVLVNWVEVVVELVKQQLMQQVVVLLVVMD